MSDVSLLHPTLIDFGHINILKYCNRPFGSVQDMNSYLIDKWNSIVNDDDITYFLGDFAMGPGVDELFIYNTICALKGQKFVVLGNHDEKSKYGLGLKAILQNMFDDIIILDDQIINRKIDGKNFIMSHFPLEDWEGKKHGAVHLHGHTHGNSGHHKLNSIMGRYDIGVDVYGGPVEITGDLRYLNDPKGWSKNG